MSDETTVGPEKTIGARLQRLIPYVVAAAASTVATIFALRLWQAHPGVPFGYSGDLMAHGLHLEQLDSHAWYFSEGRLGAPFGQHFQDWPLPDLLHLLTAKFFSLFTGNWAVIMNAMFLVGFPLAAVSATWVFRRLNLSTPIAISLGVLYSVLPYHFVRGENHLFLAQYYTVPLCVWLGLCTLNGTSMFSSKKRTVGTVAMCLLAGIGGVYYAVFTLMLVALAFVLRLVITHNWRDVIPGVTICALVVAFVLMATAPTLIYHAQHGPNQQAGERNPQDSDVYGLKIAQMLMPADNHFVEPLRNLQEQYYAEFPIPSERGSAALGLVGSVGLLYMFGLAIVTLVRPRDVDFGSRRHQYAALSIPLVLIGTVGGISTFVALLLSSEIRSWNRISIFVAVMALATSGMLLDRLAKKMTIKHVGVVLAVVVGVFGVCDQASGFYPPYDEISAQFLSDQNYFGHIEQTMPTGARIYELPSMVFPESPGAGSLGAYDMMKPYLQTHDLRWSFGGVKGRLESDWQTRLERPTEPGFAKELVATGFTGVYINRNGYNGDTSNIERQIVDDTGALPSTNVDSTQVFYDLRQYAAEQQRLDPVGLQAFKTRALYPVYAEPGTDFFAAEYDQNRSWWWADGDDAKFAVEDTTKKRETSRISFEVATNSQNPARVDIAWPDGSKQTLMAGAVPVFVSKDVALQTGESKVEVRTNAPHVDLPNDSRDLRFRLFDVTVAPPCCM